MFLEFPYTFPIVFGALAPVVGAGFDLTALGIARVFLPPDFPINANREFLPSLTEYEKNEEDLW